MKREVIVSVARTLSREERKNYKQEHPGYRLSLWLRHPWLPYIPSILMSVLAIVISIVQISR